jgi:hypothetical protein
MTATARYEAREVITGWVKDQIGVRDAEIMWIGRRRQLLLHEKGQVGRPVPFPRRNQKQRNNHRTRKNSTSIKVMTPDMVIWAGADGWEHQELGIDWIDQEKQ